MGEQSFLNSSYEVRITLIPTLDKGNTHTHKHIHQKKKKKDTDQTHENPHKNPR